MDPFDASTPLPCPVFYDQTESPLSTKRDMLRRTPARSSISMPRLAKSMPAVGRLRSRLNDLRTRHPMFISFTGKKDDILANSKTYDPASLDTYFEQCFTIQRKLGAGSFGEVFCVRSKDDLSLYAVKRSMEPFRSAVDREQKLREVEKHQTVGEHPNLVHFVRAWEEGGLLYIQTELCDQSLEQLVANMPNDTYTVPEDIVWRYCYDLLQAVDYLHSHNLIHVDIKPANIFVTSSGICKLGDFGLMMDLSKDKITSAEEGDSKYLALEVLNGHPNTASDIFSLGITILELASGIFLPSYGAGWEMLRNKNIPPEFTKGLSQDLVDLINRMMDSDSAARPTAKKLLRHPRFRDIHSERKISFLGQCCFWISFGISYFVQLLLRPAQMVKAALRKSLAKGRPALKDDNVRVMDLSVRKKLFAHSDSFNFSACDGTESWSQKSDHSFRSTQTNMSFGSYNLSNRSPTQLSQSESSITLGSPRSTKKERHEDCDTVDENSPAKRVRIRKADDIYLESSSEEDEPLFIRNAMTMPVRLEARGRTRTGMKRVGKLDFSKIE